MKKAKMKALQGDEWQIEGDLMLKEGKVYVPKDEVLRAKVNRLHHDMLVAGHRGRWKITELVTRNYWWPGVTRDVGRYVEGCDMCQWIKNRDAILVVYNWLSKMVYFVATTEGTLVKGLARLFRDNVWKLYRLPESIVLDREPQFVAELTKELNRMLGIETRLLTAFHLQTDGQIKQINQKLKQYLRFFVEHRQKDWPEWLVSAEFVVNNKVHIATKILPFMANYRRELRMGGDIRRKGKVEKAMEFVERIKQV